MSLKPLRDLVVIRRDEPKMQTDTGIILRPGTVDAPDQGVVVAAGEGHYFNDKYIKSPIKTGDRVLFGKNVGVPIKHEGEELFLLRSVDVYAILK